MDAVVGKSDQAYFSTDAGR